jgi:adenosylcobinamide kinase / adenosylcobinamide-phosphate guanylyltransferase
MKLILVTGGARSGKSTWAERRAAEIATGEGSQVLYIATAEILDSEMELRVRQHQSARPTGWTTVEAARDIAGQLESQESPTGSILLLDCVTMLASNVMTSEGDTVDPSVSEQVIRAELEEMARVAAARAWTLILVTNEVGGGIVPLNPLARQYRDVVGRINQWLAAQADEVWYVVSGIALPLHSLGYPVTEADD